ncbi:hypothetical protein ACWF50_13080 [Brucella pseudogrignonensis]
MTAHNQTSKIQSAKELAEDILAWAKIKNLFAKVPLDDAVDFLDGNRFNNQIDRSFKSQATEDILRKKSINLVGFDEENKKVVIFTNGKISKAEEKILPFNTDGFVIDYLQGGIAQVKGNPPLPEIPSPFYLHNGMYTCGSSIYPAHCIGAGTLGLLTVDNAGQIFGLTNNHVSGACNNAMPGLPILAPGPLDATETACDPFAIGRHSRLLPINDGIPENIDISVNWDASLLSLCDANRVTSMQGTYYDTPSVVREPKPSSIVKKVGRTTGLTKGKIVAQAACPIPVDYLVNEYGVKKKVFFETVYIVEGENGQPFSRPGDSGSLVVSQDENGIMESVGLVFAGNEQRALSFILPLPAILDKLNVSVLSGHNV